MEKIEKKQQIEFFQNEYDNALNVQHEINKDFREVALKVIVQRRELLKHITLISSATLGFAIIILSESFQINNVFNQSVFVVGIILHIIVIISSLAYLRELIDGESEKLQKMQDRYNDIMDKKKELLQKYINYVVKENDEFVVSKYLSELRLIDKKKKLSTEIKEMKKNRQDRISGKNKDLDYFFELIIALFSVAFFLILIAFFKLSSNICFVGSVSFFLFLASFFDVVSYFSKKMSKVIIFFKNKR